MLKNIRIILILLSATFLTVSCSSKNNNKVLEESDKQELSQLLIKGKTTEAEVRAKFGEPKVITTDKNGKVVWEYADDKTSMNPLNIVPITRNVIGVTGTKKRLYITFDNKIVSDYVFTDKKGITRKGLLTINANTKD